MKKIIISLISVLALLAVASCEKFLTENPTTSLSESTVYASESALEADVIGLYASIKQGSLYQGKMAEFLQNCSILIHWRSQKTTDEYTQCYTLGFYSDYSKNEDIFKELYRTVYRCNMLCSKLPDSPVDEAFKAEVEGEARFIRAYIYFTLVRMYGDVPVTTTPPASVDDANLPRTPYQQVYAQILEDLSFAEKNMRSEARQHEVTGLTGRPYNWAATAVKAEVYTQIGSILDSPDDQWFDTSKPGRAPDFSACGINSAADAWKLALETAEDVIAHSGYQLTPDYRQLFRWDVDNHPEDFQLKERIFVINSVDAVKASNYIMYRSLPQYPEGSSNYTTVNNNYGRIAPNRYVFQKWAKTYGGKLATGRKDGFKNVYTSCKDPRFDATYFYNSYVNLNKGKSESIYPKDGKVYKYDIPYFKKYNNPRYDVGNGYADMYLVRFAEMYLIAAEAAASLSTSKGDANWQKALANIEVLHKRARQSVDSGESAYPSWSGWDFADKNELIVAIFWERWYEMSCEGHEFFDMRRRGAKFIIDNLIKPVNAFLKEPEQDGQHPDRADDVKSTSGYWQYPWNSVQMSEDVQQIRKGLLCAYPLVELQYNSALTEADQNDFYVK